jgi:hypothetical protein
MQVKQVKLCALHAVPSWYRPLAACIPRETSGGACDLVRYSKMGIWQKAGATAWHSVTAVYDQVAAL